MQLFIIQAQAAMERQTLTRWQFIEALAHSTLRTLSK